MNIYLFFGLCNTHKIRVYETLDFLIQSAFGNIFYITNYWIICLGITNNYSELELLNSIPFLTNEPVNWVKYLCNLDKNLNESLKSRDYIYDPIQSIIQINQQPFTITINKIYKCTIQIRFRKYFYAKYTILNYWNI